MYRIACLADAPTQMYAMVLVVPLLPIAFHEMACITRLLLEHGSNRLTCHYPHTV